MRSFLFVSVVFCSFWAYGTTRTDASSSPCALADQTVTLANAASNAAENEKATSLYQTAIEQFELCRAGESLSTTSGLSDILAEAHSQLNAASLLYEDEGTNSSRAMDLMVGALKSIVRACTQYVNPPPQTRMSLAADLFLIKGLNRINSVGFNLETLDSTCSNWPATLPSTQ